MSTNIKAPEKRKPEVELPFHPSANVFELMKGAEFDELVADIKRRGLRAPITVHKGEIIEGRNRARACAEAGVTPRYQEFDGSDEDVDRYIISMNIHRRHLTPDDRRDALVKLLKLHPEKSDRAIAAETGFSAAAWGLRVLEHEAARQPDEAEALDLPLGFGRD